MVFFREYLPHPALHAFVQHYSVLHIQRPSGHATTGLPAKPYPPNTEQCLYFYPFDLPHSIPDGQQAPIAAAASNVVGQQITRYNITINPDYLMLKVSFRPGALFRLLGMPLYHVTDTAADLETIIGRGIRELNEQLPEAADYAAMVRIIDAFLLKKAAGCRYDLLPIDKIAQQMLHVSAYHQLDRFAAGACLSIRQFERKFRERVGVSPKLFTRIARFSHAYQLRTNQPDRSWTDIAYACHYYDPTHLVKDFQQFAGTSPGQLFADDTAFRQFFAGYETSGIRI
nr:helix-turn-helix domain-containing protein [uncultured Arsenicibacter sp.]